MVASTEDAIEPTRGRVTLPPWPFLETLPAGLDAGDDPVAAFREALAAGDASLRRRYEDDEPVEALVRDRARMVDVILRRAWSLYAGSRGNDVALVAVGGYGRGELHPCSDIDVLILLPKTEVADDHDGIGRFLTFLWDIGLEVGHSVRTIDDCQRESAADVSVATTLIEARLLAGPDLLVQAMRRALGQDRVWSSQAFFEAKVAEQQARHRRHHDTAYNLEPNVKTGPGGLRDIQTVGWVAKRHFGAETFDELVEHGFLTAGELRKLRSAQAFLWKARFALHVITGRREDRLLFDHQIRLAKMFGYEDATYTLAVEQFMQRYYRTVMDVSLLNEMLLQLFREAILGDGEAEIVPLNPRFQVRNDYLEITSDDVFARHPSAILELFRLMQDHAELRGVRATTIRALGRHLWLIDEEFRQNPRHHRLFLDFMRAPQGVTHELRRMNLYGVLGRYIPAFGRIVGRMQYDLFHAYTVDAHTLFVVRNLRRLVLPRFEHEFPDLSRLMRSLPRPEIVLLAALFHDIAKGRGGDHSELGAVDAEAFCLEQGLSRYDARLVAWLVRNHLLFSVTAQKKDISDPKVIQDFARAVGDQTHLDYLYLLTVADVRGTNPKLWNSWKSSLFHDFYERVKRALRRGLEAPVDQEELVAETRAAASELLARHGHGPDPDGRCLVPHERRLLPAPYARGDRLAHPPARRARGRRRLAAGGGARGDRARRQLGAHLHAAPPAQFRAHDRTARPDGPQHRGRTDHRARRRLEPGHLPGARGHRHADRRPAPRARDRAAAVARAAAAGGRDSARRHPPRAAPGAHVLDAHADHLHRGPGAAGHDPRTDRRGPPGVAVGGRQGAARGTRGRGHGAHHDHRRACRGRVPRHRRSRPPAHRRRPRAPAAEAHRDTRPARRRDARLSPAA